jgi:hypothetical protein
LAARAGFAKEQVNKQQTARQDNQPGGKAAS